MGRNSIMGSRWSITPDEANNIAAENYLALLNIQGRHVVWNCVIRQKL